MANRQGNDSNKDKKETRGTMDASSDEVNKTKDNEAIEKSISSGFTNKEIEFICKNGEKYFKNPKILAVKLNISYERAELALQILKSSKRKSLNKYEIEKIESCLRDHPGFESSENIALVVDISEELVTEYLDSKTFTDKQKDRIINLFNKDNEIDVIVRELNSTKSKVQQFVDITFLTFSGEEGANILNIILKQRNMGDYSGWKIREMVISNDLKLQDQLCYQLSKTNKEEFLQLSRYFKKFNESKSFLEIDNNLTMDWIFSL